MMRIALLVGALVSLAGPGAADVVEFLYVEPDAGMAGGGHAAVRLGPDVYHFRNEGGRALRMAREPADFFRYAYSVRGNRSIHGARVEVEPEASARLREGFARRLAIERKQFAVLEDLRADVRLLDHVAQSRAAGLREAPSPLALPATGFFVVTPNGRPASPSLVRLRSRLGGRLAVERERAWAALRELAPRLADPSELVPASDAYPRVGVRFSQRYANAASKLAALDALRSGAGLRGDALRVVPGPRGRITPAERARLERFAAHLDERLLALVGSGRPDWGYPVLVGMARRVAVEETLTSGRWVVLDAYPEPVAGGPAAAPVPHRDFLEELRADAGRRFDRARARAANESGPRGAGPREDGPGLLDEIGYGRLEEAANRMLELEGARRDARPIRVAPATLVPSRAGAWRPIPVPDVSDRRLDGLRREARALADRYEAALLDLHGYRLFRHNCVTELFRTVDGVFTPAESTRYLGGRVAPGGPVEFVPAAAFARVRSRYRVSELVETPSFRRARLEELYSKGHPVAVYLRESNTFTSSIYRRDPTDSYFVFFTDDAGWARPLLGSVNVVAGLGETLVGLARSPVDGGRTLERAGRGLLFSLPDLAWVNFRKGSMAYAPGETARTGPHVRLQP